MFCDEATTSRPSHLTPQAHCRASNLPTLRHTKGQTQTLLSPFHSLSTLYLPHQLFQPQDDNQGFGLGRCLPVHTVGLIAEHRPIPFAVRAGHRGLLHIAGVFVRSNVGRKVITHKTCPKQKVRNIRRD